MFAWNASRCECTSLDYRVTLCVSVCLCQHSDESTALLCQVYIKNNNNKKNKAKKTSVICKCVMASHFVCVCVREGED